MNRNPISVSFVWRLLLITASMAGVILLWHYLSAIDKNLSSSGSGPRIVTPRGELATDEMSTIELFEKARGSVVYISTSQLMQDVWSRDVFSVPRGTGSGIIWDDAGHIVTNLHVIEGASKATVFLADGRKYQASLIGASPRHDLALLKIGVGFRRLVPVPIGSSSNLRVGQKVFAIGNPFGLDWTLTTGIISALDRTLPSRNGGTDIEQLIQTDAAINPGNSGGPLLDSSGRLIGVSTAILSPSGASAGIGFAVPVDTVMRVIPELISKRLYYPPSLGIDVDQQVNERLKELTGRDGVFILGVRPDSAAAAAGLVAITIDQRRIALGDVIAAIDGREVDSLGDLLTLLDAHKVGDVVRLTVIREDRSRDVSVKLQRDEGSQ